MQAGSAILFVGVCGLIYSLLSSAGVVHGVGSGNDQRFLVMGVSGALIAAGISQLRRKGGPTDGWQPAVPGVRFQRVIVYSREGCGLCDEAVEVLERYSKYFNDLSVVSIAENEDLTEKYGTTIPVVKIDGEERFRGRVEERLLRRLIEGTEPLG